jgi:hypothetical protein
MTWIWDRIRGIGGNRSDEADELEELGGEDPGEAEEEYVGEMGHDQMGGLAAGDAADVVEADLDELKGPGHP